MSNWIRLAVEKNQMLSVIHMFDLNLASTKVGVVLSI